MVRSTTQDCPIALALLDHHDRLFAALLASVHGLLYAETGKRPGAPAARSHQVRRGAMIANQLIGRREGAGFKVGKTPFQFWDLAALFSHGAELGVLVKNINNIFQKTHGMTSRHGVLRNRYFRLVIPPAYTGVTHA